MTQNTSFVYASIGPQIEVFKLDPDRGDLHLVQSLTFGEVVQYACANRARTILYVVCSGAGPMVENKVENHFVQSFHISQNGMLTSLQEPQRLGNRPIFVSLDGNEDHLLLAYNNPSDVTVHALGPGGAIGDEVMQNPLYFGLTVHQVRPTPHGNIIVVPASAHCVNGIPAGCVDVFDYENGRLTPRARIKADPRRTAGWQGVKNGAQGFSARHVAFHPTQPWMYLLVETQGELQLYDCDQTGIALTPRRVQSTLTNAPVGLSSQLAGAIHMHPNGRYIYVTNRAWGTGADGCVDGANTIAVFKIDLSNGAPKLVQQIETRGIFPRAFGIDAAGQMLVVGNQEPGEIRLDGIPQRVVPSLVSFKIGNDGRLTFAQKHDFGDTKEVCFWTSILTPSGREMLV